MTILVFNGSPKRDKSDTLRITRAFLEGMQEAAVVTEPRLALVRKAGHQFARTREIAPELIAEIGTPMIPEEQYAATVNGGV